MTPLTLIMLLSLQAADGDGDQVITGADIAILLGHWGEAGPAGDVNLDGVVNSADIAAALGLWSVAFGRHDLVLPRDDDGVWWSKYGAPEFPKSSWALPAIASGEWGVAWGGTWGPSPHTTADIEYRRLTYIDPDNGYARCLDQLFASAPAIKESATP